MVEIGRKIRQYRQQLDLTQEELAQRTELTKGFISQLENDLCSPSIATLEDILSVLGVSLQEFFAEPRRDKVVYGESDYFVSDCGSGQSTWLITDSQSKQMEPIILTLRQGEQSVERYPFEGEEFGYVIAGSAELVIGEEVYRVQAGESFSLSGDRQHLLRNVDSIECRILWVTTPSNF